jgi:hypothetical protein
VGGEGKGDGDYGVELRQYKFNKYAPPVNGHFSYCNLVNTGQKLPAELKYNNLVKNQLLLPEMEFLDINLTKDSSLLLQAIHSPFFRQILKKTILLSGF